MTHVLLSTVRAFLFWSGLRFYRSCSPSQPCSLYINWNVNLFIVYNWERERWEEGDEFLWEIYGESCFPAAKLAFVGICVAKWAHVDARFRLDRLPIVVKPSEISRAENDFQTVRLEKYTVSTLRRYSSIILYVMPILKSAQRNLICFPFPFPFFFPPLFKEINKSFDISGNESKKRREDEGR